FHGGAQAGARRGLLGMPYRVEAEGGSMRLLSSPGQGTLIEAILPAGDIDPPTASAAAPHAVPAGRASSRPRARVGCFLRQRGCSPDRAARAYPIALGGEGIDTRFV